MGNEVAKPSNAVNLMSKDWGVVGALLGGTQGMRAAAQELLPKWPAESDDSYKFRLKVATLFPAYGRTVGTMTSKPFSRQITLPSELSDEWKKWFENVDLQGTSLSAFAADSFYQCMGYGIAGVVVDCPPRGETPNTLAAEQEAGIRPYFARVLCKDVLGWQAKLMNGEWQLTQFRFFEYIEEATPDGYGTVCVKQIRVWNIGYYEIWRLNPLKDDDWILFDKQAVSIDFVPFEPFYGKRTGFMTGTPPLIDLAYLNVKHWQSQSDQDNILHVARVPILVVNSDDENFSFKISSNTGMRLPVGSDAKYVEHSGSAIEAGAKSLEELKDEMRQAGAELLIIRPTQATATEINSDDDVGTCELQRIVQGFTRSLNNAIAMLAKWTNQTPPKDVKIYDDFGGITVADGALDILFKSADGGLVSHETYYEELQRRGAISSEIPFDEDQKRIAKQPKPEPVKEITPNVKPPL